MRIFVFGSSLTSSYWNGAATYYRGIYKSLAELGFQITFAEPDAFGRQQHRDNEDFGYAKVNVYDSPRDIPRLVRLASESDLVIKHSGVGVDDALLEEFVLECRSASTQVAFWDVDAPATLASVEANPLHLFRPLIPEYDYIFTYGGGAPVVGHYLRLGARACHPIYNALDPATHFPVAPDPIMQCGLAFVGNRLPDREHRVEEFFLAAAESAPEFSFLLGGEGWGARNLPANVRWIGHVGTTSHNRVNCSARLVLNINRDSMASVGFSPPTRVFEAAGAAACLITDHWAGIEEFFTPGCEILVARDARDITDLLKTVDARLAREIGESMRKRALQEHTYALRALQVREILQQSSPGVLTARSHELYRLLA
jgi:spore maturation protein CgeB